VLYTIHFDLKLKGSVLWFKYICFIFGQHPRQFKVHFSLRKDIFIAKFCLKSWCTVVKLGFFNSDLYNIIYFIFLGRISFLPFHICTISCVVLVNCSYPVFACLGWCGCGMVHTIGHNTMSYMLIITYDW